MTPFCRTFIICSKFTTFCVNGGNLMSSWKNYDMLLVYHGNIYWSREKKNAGLFFFRPSQFYLNSSGAVIFTFHLSAFCLFVFMFAFSKSHNINDSFLKFVFLLQKKDPASVRSVLPVPQKTISRSTLHVMRKERYRPCSVSSIPHLSTLFPI